MHKIRNQSSLLEFYGLKEAQMLDGYIEELEFNDITNREGHAAKVYLTLCLAKALLEVMTRHLTQCLIMAIALFCHALIEKL